MLADISLNEEVEDLKLLSVRLPESEIRRFKILAASRGVSLQEAAHQAIQAWTSDESKNLVASLEALRGSLAGFDIDRAKREEREAEREREARRL